MAVCILQLTHRPTWKEFSCATMQNSKSCSSSPYFSLARSSPEIAPPRRSEEICRQLLLSLHLLARSSLARVLSFSSSVYLFPARTLTRHCAAAAAAASTHFGLTCHFFTLSLSSSLSCSCSSSSSLARTPSCYVLWEFGYPPRWLQSEIEWMDGIIDGLLNFQDCHSPRLYLQLL